MTCSVVLHSLLLWAAPPRLERAAGAAPLAATLRAAERPAPEASAPAAAAAKVSRPGTAAVPAPVSVARAPAETARPAAAGDERDERPAVPTPAAAGAAPDIAPLAAPVAADDGPDADGLRAYRIGLARAARGHRRYPALARERGWTGTAEVEVDVSRQGRPRQVLLARSSGHDILDSEALAMVTRAAAAAALPESLRGRDFAVRLPVVFDLADAQ